MSIGYNIPNQQNINSFQVHMDEFSRVDHKLGHRANLNKFKMIVIR